MESEEEVFQYYRQLFKLNKELLKDVNAVYVQRPLILALLYCSKSDSDEITADVPFKYFREPTVGKPLDLNTGFLPGQHRPPKILTGIDKVQKFLLKENVALNSAEIAPKSASNANGNSQATRTILTQRGCLMHLMCIPYAWRTDQLFHIVKYSGVIILIDTSLLNKDKLIKETEFHANIFKHYCFSEKFNGNPDVNSNFNSGESFFGIYRSNLQHFNIIYGGDFEGIVSNRQITNKLDINEINKLQFVTTKTIYRKDEYNYYYTNNLRLRWWVGAYLAKVDDFFIGRKDEDGKVRCPVEHKTAHRLEQEIDYDLLICNQFLYKFLTYVEEIMVDVDCPYTVYEFQYDAALLSVQYKIYERSDLSYLSAEFIEYLKKHTANKAPVSGSM